MNQYLEFGFSDNTNIETVRKQLSALAGVRKVYQTTATGVRVHYNEDVIAAKVIAKAARECGTNNRKKANIIAIKGGNNAA